jgi:TusA-related sulfurtransferase
MTSSSLSSSPPTSSSPGERSQVPADPGAPSTLNLCGEICPFTFVRTKLALEALPIGAVLRVIVDHEPATRNIPRSAAEWGQEVLEVTPSGGHGGAVPGTWAIDLRKRVR